MAPFSKMAPRRSLALILALSRSISPHPLYIPYTVYYAFLFIMSLPITLSIKTYYTLLRVVSIVVRVRLPSSYTNVSIYLLYTYLLRLLLRRL
jgi:hypothetical protein